MTIISFQQKDLMRSTLTLSIKECFDEVSKPIKIEVDTEKTSEDK